MLLLLPFAYCLLPSTLSALILGSALSHPAGDKNEDDGDDAHDRGEGTHGSQVAIHIEVVEKRSNGLRAWRVKENRRAELPQINGSQDDPTRDEPGPHEREENAAE